MKNLKIGPKLVASFLLVVILTLFIGIYLLHSLEIVDDNADTMYEKGIVPLGYLGQTIDLTQEIRVQIMYWRVSKTEEARSKAIKTIDDARRTVDDLIKKQEELLLTEKGKDAMKDLREKIDKYVGEAEAYMKSASRDESGMSPTDYPPSFSKSGGEMRQALNVVIDLKNNANSALAEENSHVAHSAESIAKTILAAVVIFSIALCFFLTLSITRPLKTVVDVLSKIEKGDMTVRAELNRGDEFGILSKALDSLSSRLQTIFKNLRQNSDTLAGSAEELSWIASLQGCKPYSRTSGRIQTRWQARRRSFPALASNLRKAQKKHLSKLCLFPAP